MICKLYIFSALGNSPHKNAVYWIWIMLNQCSMISNQIHLNFKYIFLYLLIINSVLHYIIQLIKEY